VVDFKQMDGKMVQEKQANDFLLHAAKDTNALNNLMQLGMTHLKMKTAR